jgi:hypothetical protein
MEIKGGKGQWFHANNSIGLYLPKERSGYLLLSSSISLKKEI